MSDKNNWQRAAGCLLIRNGKVLLVRHTYGDAKDKLLIPGGYSHIGEQPERTAERELFEETKITATAGDLVSMRFTPDSWFAVFLMEYVSGEPTSDAKENSEVVFMDIDEACTHPEVTEFTRYLLTKYLENKRVLKPSTDYPKVNPISYSFYL